MTLKKERLNRSEILKFGILLTASFDIVGTIDLWGMTFRFVQILIVIAGVYLIKTAPLLELSEGYQFLLVWLILQFIACFTCDDYKYSFGYFFWTLLDVAVIIIFLGLTKTKKQADRLLCLFIYSFVAISVLGIFQFVMSLFGTNFFLTQPTLNGTSIPRLNGFTYEPSYYATYLLPGWVLTMYLAEKGSALFPKEKMMLFAVIISCALFLSTSRMGWACMALWITFRGASLLREIIKGRLKRSKMAYMLIMTAGIIAVLVVAVGVIKTNGMEFLISGLGIGGTSNHSSSSRINAMVGTIKLLKYSPWIGLSIGGVPVMFCKVYGILMDTGATMCVWVELLVASGVVGVAFFGLWIIRKISSLIKKKDIQVDRYIECKGVLYAFVFECLILALNQNILRIYFWTMIGIVTVAGERYKNTSIRKEKK